MLFTTSRRLQRQRKSNGSVCLCIMYHVMNDVFILVYSQAKCIKTGPGTHTCQCLSGWREDGDGCQAINNCLDPTRGGCHPNATCIYVGPGQVRVVVVILKPHLHEFILFLMIDILPRVIVLAKVVTMETGSNVNLSISVWNRRVDAISWSVFEQIITHLHTSLHAMYACQLHPFIFPYSHRAPASF